MNDSQLVSQLLELDDDLLASQLGLQCQKVQAGDESIEVMDPNSATRGFDTELLSVGQNLLKRLSAGLYDLLCKPLGADPETQKVFDEVVNQNYDKAAMMLSPLFISGLGLAPSIATVLSVLVVKKIAKAGSDEVCKIWLASLPKETGEST